MAPFSTTANGKIGTPKGDYTPRTDDLKKELNAAAQMCGYSQFRVWIDGNQIVEEGELQTNSLRALNADIRVEPYDKAG